MRRVQPPNRDTKQPRLKAPPGACDTHLHIYGPPELYPLSPERNYTPDRHSTLDDYLNVQRKLGSFKALALLDPAITEAELLHLKESGFTGFRVKVNGRGGLSFEDTKKIVPRVEDFGWHVEFMSQSLDEVLGSVPSLRGLKIPYVFDHVAHVEPGMTESNREFKELLQILAVKSMSGLT